MADETKIVGIKVTADTGSGTSSLKTMEDASGALLSGLTTLEGGIKLVTLAAGTMGVAFGAVKLAELTKETILLTARYDTLGIVMNVTGKNAMQTSGQMAEMQAGLQKTGISAIEARNGLVRMGQANIDMAYASKLARIAQDAAVVGNINSSEAFERMTTGLATGQSILLHHLGLMTNFEQAYLNAAHATGRTTSDLSETEKGMIRMNEVIRAGTGITGAYEAAMGTVGKQLTSLPRYIQDLMVKAGEFGQGALFEGVSTLTTALKFLTKNFEEVSNAAGTVFTGAAIVGVGLITSKLMGFAESLALSSQHSQALRMNTLYNTEATVTSAETKLAETQAMVANNTTRLASIDALILETKQQFWASQVLQERIVAEGTLTALEQRRTIVVGELAASQGAQTSAQTVANIATNASTVATGEASIAGRVLTGVTNGLNSAMGMLGGPIGVIAIAVGGLEYAWVKAGEAAEEARIKHDKAWSNSGTSKLLQEITEKEAILKQATQTPAQASAESAQQLATKMTQLKSDEVRLVAAVAEARKKIEHPAAWGMLVDQPGTLAGNLGQMEGQLAAVRLDIARVPQLIALNAELDEKVAAAKKKKNDTTKPAKPTEYTDTTDADYKRYETAFDSFDKRIAEGNPHLTEYDKAIAGINAEVRRAIDLNPVYADGLREQGAVLKQQAIDAWKLKNAREEFTDFQANDDTTQNYFGKMGIGRTKGADGKWASQQDRFDASAMTADWAARGITSDRASGKQGDSFSAAMSQQEGDNGHQAKLLQIQTEAEAYETSWAMQTDSFEVYQNRMSAIEDMAGKKRVALKRSEEQTKLGLIASGAGQTGDIMLQLHNLLGKRDKVAFRAFQAAKSGETIISTASGVMKAWDDPSSATWYERAAKAVIVGAAGAMNLATIWAADPDGGSGSAGAGGAAGSPTAAGGTYNPVVTQPGSTAMGSGINITVQVQGNVISDDRWVEERLAPAIRDLAVNRNVSFGFTPSS